MGSPMHSHRTLSPPLSWSGADEHRLSGGDGGPSAVPGDFVGRMAHEQGQVLLPDRVVRRGLVCFDTAPQFWRHRLDERHSRHTEGVTGRPSAGRRPRYRPYAGETSDVANTWLVLEQRSANG